MQAAAPPPSPTAAADLTASAIAFAAEIDQAQRNALQTIHKMMLLLADTLTNPQGEAGHGGDTEQEEKKKEDVERAKTTTQRIRLCLQAARDLLRYGPARRATTDDAPPSPRSNTPRGQRKAQPATPPDHPEQPLPSHTNTRASSSAHTSAPSETPNHPATPAPQPTTTTHAAPNARDALLNAPRTASQTDTA